MNPQARKKIDKNKYYRPREIARYKLIKSSRGDCSYNFVLNEIKNGNWLNAENRGKGKTPYYLVKGEQIIKYNKRHNFAFYNASTFLQRNRSNSILMVCPFCGRVQLNARMPYDPIKAIWCKNSCGCNSEKFYGEIYYGEEGEIL